ncbi:MAG: hypothetical protein WCC57_16315 [Paracoccaceae bacterium]
MTAAFDTVIVVDWSASATPSPARPSSDAIWIGVCRETGEQATYHRTRHAAETALKGVLHAERQAGRRVLAGFDFPLGYPAGFAQHLTGTPKAQAVWQWLENHVTDGPDNQNFRFKTAQDMNRRFPGSGPFWGRPSSQPLPDLPPTKAVDYPALGLSERRLVETVVPRAQSVWKLYTTGSVGSQAIMGLPMIHRLSKQAAVWPFVAPHGPLVLAEVYPSLIDKAVNTAMKTGEIKDAAQVRLLARALWRLSQSGRLDALLCDIPDWPGRSEEGWILGATHAEALLAELA